MNVATGKCLDASKTTSLVFERACDPFTAKPWKLENKRGRQLLCDGHSGYVLNCISRSIKTDGHPPSLTLLPWLDIETDVSVVKNQIRILNGTTQMNATERLPCVAAAKTHDPVLYTTITVQDCNDNYKNQTWSFVSF